MFPFLGFSQAVPPTLQELVDKALAIDGTLNEQQLQNKLTALNDEKLKDIFLPKLDISGKAGYMYTSVGYTTPEIHLPPIPKLFPGKTIPDYSNNLNISGISSLAKAEASMVLYSGGKVKYLKQANVEKALSEEQMMEKTKDDIVTTISKAYDQLALLEEARKVLEESKKRLDINQKTADKALGSQ